MALRNVDDVKLFGQRVERLTTFFLTKLEAEGDFDPTRNDIRQLIRLRDDAIDLQNMNLGVVNTAIAGLGAAVSGATP